MSVITFPSALYAVRMSWAQQRNDTENRSIFGAQAVEVSAPLWVVSMEGPMKNDTLAGEWKTLLMRLRGKTNQLALWDLMRTVPLGTMRGTLTFNTAPAAGATSLSITGGAGQAGTTLLQGDLLGFGSGLTQQVVMVVANATANGSGVIAVTVEPALRNAFSGGASVVWDQPKVLFRRSSSKAGWDYTTTVVSGFVLDLIEDPRP
jgi:hypothetical protein